MKLDGPEVKSTVIVTASVHGVEPIEMSEGGTIFFHPNHIQVVYTANYSVWEAVVTVTAVLSLSRQGDERESCWGAAPMRWRGGAAPQPNLDGAPGWVREFVERNHPLLQVGLRCIR